MQAGAVIKGNKEIPMMDSPKPLHRRCIRGGGQAAAHPARAPNWEPN